VVGLLLLGEEEEEAAAREEEAERAQLRFEVEFRFLCGVDSLDRSGEDGPTYFLFFFFVFGKMARPSFDCVGYVECVSA